MVSFEDVSMCYQGSKEDAITHISFTAGAGETIGIIGGTGSGKSTVVNLIPRFYDASAGRVCFFGQDVRKYRRKELRNQIGIVPQKQYCLRERSVRICSGERKMQPMKKSGRH